jgi:hypothetical protein
VRVVYRLGREIEVKRHLAVGRGSIMRELEQFTPEGGNGCLGCDRHGRRQCDCDGSWKKGK